MFKTEVEKYIHSDLNIVLLYFLELREASSIPVRTDRPKNISSQHPYRQEKEKQTNKKISYAAWWDSFHAAIALTLRTLKISWPCINCAYIISMTTWMHWRQAGLLTVHLPNCNGNDTCKLIWRRYTEEGWGWWSRTENCVLKHKIVLMGENRKKRYTEDDTCLVAFWTNI